MKFFDRLYLKFRSSLCNKFKLEQLRTTLVHHSECIGEVELLNIHTPGISSTREVTTRLSPGGQIGLFSNINTLHGITEYFEGIKSDDSVKTSNECQEVQSSPDISTFVTTLSHDTCCSSSKILEPFLFRLNETGGRVFISSEFESEIKQLVGRQPVEFDPLPVKSLSGERHSVLNLVNNLVRVCEMLHVNSETDIPGLPSHETLFEEDTEIDLSNIESILEYTLNSLLETIRKMISEETLLRADNMRQFIIFELKSLAAKLNPKYDSKLLSIANLFLNKLILDEDMKILAFKMDQIRSAFKFFHLTQRFNDFHLSNQPIDKFDTNNTDKVLLHSTGPASRTRILSRIIKWYRSSHVFEKDGMSLRKGHSNSKTDTSGNNKDANSILVPNMHSSLQSHRYHHSGDTVDKFQFETDGWSTDNSKGIVVLYRIDPMSIGLSVSVIVKGEINCNPIHLLAILNEVELAHEWAPYMSYASRIASLSRVSQLVQQIYDLPWPIGQRENIMYCFGVDTLHEQNCLMISCSNPKPDSTGQFLGVEIPDPPPKIPREECSHLFFIITPLDSGKSVTMEMFANFNVSRFVPSKLASFIVRRMTRKMYTDIAHLASNFKGSIYESAYKENSELYLWIEKKFSDYLRMRNGCQIMEY
ncbi:hypothetical protein cand_037010 [Cryptosporidium andersoni]|uniref:START domain-containing protein n=1 Tax=Cryptosporidium andersoni TaxID=117008 RepID=A0A1J4MYQ2_9CRYT|nr:hypothetical protein cand_037010 [Cryptosporidium andersoni]